MTLPRLGFEGGNTPFYLSMPKEEYYKGSHWRREYPPLSLIQLQRMIDTGRVDKDEVIDLTALCNSGLYRLDLNNSKDFGVQLTDEGADIFDAQINIEVQHADEVTIAAIERCGGTITTRYYDPICLHAIVDPMRFFKAGKPIPRCLFPPQDAVGYYTDPKFRGYLADPDEIAKARLELAQKFGYNLPDLSKDPKFEMLKKRKDPRQIFFGLAPGSIVNLVEKCVLKPKGNHPDAKYLVDFYSS
ncbi:hypothetical protein FSP39_016410 [Pinctada imbricata]|uniref:Large ribosomal subunit protein uL15m n=1 Tax=Pinctada imbricata TaxID=66713 RepID=A0AA88Y7Q2_PINIB|nr:hypothetical protein FSP39_016410 [Pinctada imbricata]